MSNVTLAIGGRNFTVACAEGEEDHIADLGEMIAAKISGMGDMSSQSESRMLLFAALLLADELHDATMRSPAAAPAPATPAPTAPAPTAPAPTAPAPTAPAPTAPALPDGSAERLIAIAERLENLADRLEG